jgi:hypothetical protein
MLLRKSELPVTKPTHDHLFYAVHVPHVLVIGASLAGLRAVETLRSHDFDGDITVCDTEYTVLYDRPPLSKKFLEGEWEAHCVPLRKAEELNALSVTRLTEPRVAVQNSKVDLDIRLIAEQEVPGVLRRDDAAKLEACAGQLESRVLVRATHAEHRILRRTKPYVVFG